MKIVSSRALYIRRIIFRLLRLLLIFAASLFARERWVDPRDCGYTEDEPRYMYTLDGQREEWDPRVCETKMRLILVLTSQEQRPCMECYAACHSTRY
jgi:hypothetical protein